MIKSKAELTEIKLFRNKAGAIVGYMAIHLFERELQGQAIIIVRSEAGLLHQYRGKNTTANFALKKTLAYKWRHPRKPFYYLGSLIHPSSYSLFTKYTPVLWPNYRYPTPKAIETLMSQLGDDYGLPLVDPARPLVRYVSWFTRETDLERSYWQNSTRPDVQFYIRTNSGYAEGTGY